MEDSGKKKSNHEWTLEIKNLMSLVILPELADRCSSGCIAVRRVHNVHEECSNVLEINSLKHGKNNSTQFFFNELSSLQRFIEIES